MHILLIHQAFVALDEPGGTRHHELARCLAARGHRVTVIASPVSYLTGKAGAARMMDEIVDGGSVTVLRTYTYSALHRSFVHRVFSFFSFMASSFLAGLESAPGGPGVGHLAADLSGSDRLGAGAPESASLSCSRCAIYGRLSPSRWACCAIRC